ncbi:MAG: hypothetical protein H7A44_08600 [Opitutaceae bacterium]|nr:hypothetical protein [Cephaloticoccus sp.]MCP5530490.1 hypothetical protein [Opitutaceae bacterium]
MSIHQHPTKQPLARSPSLPWGEVAPEPQSGGFVRFALGDRMVTYAASDLRRWEHVLSESEVLLISAGGDLVKVEGVRLAEVRVALENGRLRELRQSPRKLGLGDGPLVRRITINPA